ncbi:DUF1080 domain-containing protein [Pseudomaricurvus alkylphenolicus]|uniref:3-keto-disaccharide hydrolase n=1 Tax=Pseudomaricurvus alkylphenolicus TaxID=1306991 RepID=UPI0014225B1D|nr:DUF1080 domain-containing protein [Pseudomaricurvus alkylphenolicus]NIB42440.1 DUF1080 domain-containing protein [Pseudomaricurvus alkylphenolicus]
MSAEESGFTALFDGKSLQGWEGDTTYWRVEDGAIVGEVTEATLLKDYNSFLIFRGGPVRDFELRLKYRISPQGNGGVNYRSQSLYEPKWTMRGYQFDIDGPQWSAPFTGWLRATGKKIPDWQNPGSLMDPPSGLRVTGQNYDELGRHILALPGEVARVGAGGSSRVEALLGDQELVNSLVNSDWNELRIIARGNILIHIVNNHVVSIVIDDDVDSRHDEGDIGIQVHVGPPMKAEYRDIRLKRF